MNKGDDKKFWLTIGLSAFLALGGGLTSYFNALASIKDKIQETQASYRHEAESKFATKEEILYFQQSLKELKAGVDLANERLYDIQKNQVLVKVANDRLVKVQRRLSLANDNMVDLKEQVKQALEKKKK